jgi:hypothetical protein
MDVIESSIGHDVGDDVDVAASDDNAFIEWAAIAIHNTSSLALVMFIKTDR